MGTPTTTARVDPTGIRLKNGYQTLIAFERNSSINFWEVTIQPPSMDGGDAVDITTMHNDIYTTMTSGTLITLGEFNCTGAYDPSLYTDILDLLNQEGSVTIHFPDGSTLDFFGYLKSFEPDELSRDEMPSASFTVVPTNTDPSDCTEAAPVLTSVTGT